VIVFFVILVFARARYLAILTLNQVLWLLVVEFYRITYSAPSRFSHQPLPSRCHLSATRGWSTLLTQMVRSYTSTTENATININSYINDYKCIKCVVRCDIKQSRTVQLYTPDGPRRR
jgi:hypothetical protein